MRPTEAADLVFSREIDAEFSDTGRGGGHPLIRLLVYLFLAGCVLGFWAAVLWCVAQAVIRG